MTKTDEKHAFPEEVLQLMSLHAKPHSWVSHMLPENVFAVRNPAPKDVQYSTGSSHVAFSIVEVELDLEVGAGVGAGHACRGGPSGQCVLAAAMVFGMHHMHPILPACLPQAAHRDKKTFFLTSQFGQLVMKLARDHAGPLSGRCPDLKD